MARLGKFLLSFVIFVTVCYGGLVWFVNHEVAKGIDQSVAETPGMELTYSDLSVSIFDHTVSLNDVKVQWDGGQIFFAEQVNVLKFDQSNPTPHYVQAEIKGAVISATRANFGDSAELLKLIGLTALSGDIDLDYSYNPAAKSFRLETFRFDEKALGEMTLSTTLNNIDVDALRPEKIVGLKLGTADLTFADTSLVERALTAMGQPMHMDVAATRAQMARELETMAGYADSAKNTQSANAIRAFKDFIQESGTIQITARPAEPVPFIYLFMGRDFYENLRLLNLTVTADSKDTTSNQ